MKQQTYKILNEEFFDDSELTDDDVEITDDESSNENEQDYTYNLQFIIYTWCLVDYKDEFSNRITTKTNNLLENPGYKPILEHTLNSIKKALRYILESSPLITDYSTLKFCSLNKKLTTEFPFIANKDSEWLSNRFDRAITLETSINLSNRKNTEKLIKLFYSFWRLQKIYNRLLIEKLFGTQGKAPDIQLGIIRKNPYEKANLYGLLPPDKAMSPRGYELIKILNYKDESSENI